MSSSNIPLKEQGEQRDQNIKQERKEHNKNNNTTNNNERKKKRNRVTKEEKKNSQMKKREKTKLQLEAIKMRAKKYPKKAKEPRCDEDLEYWGDKLSTEREWPLENKNKKFRVIGQNVNGLSYYNEYIDWEMTLNYMDEFQADVVCLGEPNLDLNKPKVNEEIRKRLQKVDLNGKLAKSSSPTIYNDSEFKMGGTLTYTRGNWSGHVTKQGSERLGRWSYQEFEGKKGKTITVINMYRVGKGKNDSGSCTIRCQQQKDLLVDTEQHVDPREQILIDLQKKIKELHEKGHLVVLFGDFNEDVQHSNRILRFLMESNLKNAVTAKHDGKLPRTHDRGRHCIDMIAVSEALDTNAILASGYMPFYEGVATDHRAVFIDLDVDYLFANSTPDTNKQIYRRFMTDQTRKTDKYLQKLEEELEKARIFRKVEQLEKDIERFLQEGKGIKEDIIKRCINASEKTAQLMKYSERSVGKRHYNSGFPASPKLKEAALGCRWTVT